MQQYVSHSEGQALLEQCGESDAAFKHRRLGGEMRGSLRVDIDGCSFKGIVTEIRVVTRALQKSTANKSCKVSGAGMRCERAVELGRGDACDNTDKIREILTLLRECLTCSAWAFRYVLEVEARAG